MNRPSMTMVGLHLRDRSLPFMTLGAPRASAFPLQVYATFLGLPQWQAANDPSR